MKAGTSGKGRGSAAASAQTEGQVEIPKIRGKCSIDQTYRLFRK